MYTGQCVICGDKFNSFTSKQVTCGKTKCQHDRIYQLRLERNKLKAAGKYKPHGKDKCWICGDEFKKNTKTQVTCGSKDCTREHEKLKQRERRKTKRLEAAEEPMKYSKACVVCSTGFSTNSTRKTTCSKECSLENKRLKNKEKLHKKLAERKETRKINCEFCGEEFYARTSVQTACTKKECKKAKALKNHKERYSKKLENGLCIQCGNKREDLNKTMCEECCKKNSLRMSEIKEERIKKGICINCKAQTDGNTRCLLCKAKERGFSTVEEYEEWRNGTMSVPQKAIYRLLRKISKDKSISYNLKHIIPDKLELDIYSKDKKYAVEVDGITHYKNIYGRDDFDKRIENDKKKNAYCNEYGITLYRINVSDETVEHANEVCSKILYEQYGIRTDKNLLQNNFEFINKRAKAIFGRKTPLD